MIKNDIIMKRDMDLIRAILLSVETEEHGFAPKIEIPDYTQEEIGYHAVLLGEAGLAVVSNITTFGAKSPQAMVIRLTWSGHEFLDAARDKTIWNQAKDKIGSATIQVWMTVLCALALKKLGL
jgi:hypothetical protein